MRAVTSCEFHGSPLASSPAVPAVQRRLLLPHSQGSIFARPAFVEHAGKTTLTLRAGYHVDPGSRAAPGRNDRRLDADPWSALPPILRVPDR
jgi:hypothetical protein